MSTPRARSLWQDRGQPAVAAVEHPVELGDQAGVVGVRKVGEQVHALAAEPGADLDAAHQRDTDAFGDVDRLRPPLGGVVVGEGEYVHSSVTGVPDQLRGTVGAVGAVRVGMEVDPHDLSL